MRPRLLSAPFAAALFGIGINACNATPDGDVASASAATVTPPRADIMGDMVAYAEYCKDELGFRNPRTKMAFMSCFDSAGADGARTRTGRQALLSLTRRNASGVPERLELANNGPIVAGDRDTWDLMFGRGGGFDFDGNVEAGPGAEGCDNPNYLQSRCDPYYRLNVFQPDPGNPEIVAALHCRGDGQKPKPSSAILADARRAAFVDAPADTPLAEKNRLFDQWNSTNEIVLTMTNLRTGKACFFHAKSPYFGERLPAPDDETNLAAPGAVDKVWNELPLKPAYGKEDANRRSEWLRNGQNAWQRPDYMRCTGCHDSGPFMHDPFIDSMNLDGRDFLPRDKRSRPYIPLGYNGEFPPEYIKTADVIDAKGETSPQRCTTCHSMGSERACDSWFDRAVGWSFPYSASAESKLDPTLARYMPHAHGATSSAEFYADNGPHIDAMRCCCEHPSWKGCKVVPAATPNASGTEGTDARACVSGSCGGRGQPCCDGSSCNHNGLTCSGGTCKFRDE